MIALGVAACSPVAQGLPRELAQPGSATAGGLSDASRNRLWYALYDDAWEAIRNEDYALASKILQTALAHAEHFDTSDRRLAETLDDLGLVYFQLNNDFTAEMMQGRAVSELLLARGPGDPHVAVFITRLGMIYKRQGRSDTIAALQEKPYQIFELGYVVEDARLARRLDALAYEYHRAGGADASEYLTRLAGGIRRQSV